MKKFYSIPSLNEPMIREVLDVFVQRRIKRRAALLRPYLLRLAYEIAGGKEWSEIIPACAAVEILNISTYQSNLAFDNKSGILSSESKNNQFMASMVSLDISIKAILGMEESVDPIVLNRIIGLIHQANSDIYIGQAQDLKTLNISSINLAMPFDDYMGLYLNRCQKIGGSLVKLCFEVGGILGGASEKILAILNDIGSEFGTYGQIVNDIADLVPPGIKGAGKKYLSDHYSDVKAGKITYPIFFLLKYGSEKEIRDALDILHGKRTDLNSMLKLTSNLYRVGAIHNVKEILKERCEILKKMVKRLPPSKSQYLLGLVFNILLANRYFTALDLFFEKRYAYRQERSH
ncbi:MAG: polyprenyl synthetase family protein [Thermodesulfobacteriota bacterium]